MSTSYRISEKAIEDLTEIWLYTLETRSQEQGDRYYNLLIDEFEYITSHFESGKSMEPIKTGYRAIKVKYHYVFYRKAEDDIIEIIRVLHQSMAIENRFK